MNEYFISPVEKPEWALDADEFTELLQDRFLVLDLARDTDPEDKIDLQADCLVDGQPVTIVLHRGGDAVGVYGSIEAAAEVALWVNSLVPDDAALLLYDDTFRHHLALDEGTTVTEIVAVFASQD